MSTEKTKSQPKITISSKEIENVTNYECLGSIINKNGDFSKVRRRLAITIERLTSIEKLCLDVHVIRTAKWVGVETSLQHDIEVMGIGLQNCTFAV